MARIDAAPQTYYCPMHAEVRQPAPGKCTKCGMSLVPEGTRFGLLRHMLGRPMHLVLMLLAMLAIMAAAMMLMR